jgi:threonyl-tRNA synthetase
MSTFGFSEYELLLSTRPERYVGSIQMWDSATRSLASVLENLGLPYDIDPGEGVFYGPKIDIKLKDALGHAWQGPTIQVDFNLPERFDVCYIGDDGAEHPVVMIHRTVLGSMERFVACLIEHYGGVFPVWLSPIQAIIIPVADRHVAYGRQIQKELEAEGVRSRLDERAERMNLKIRDAQLQKIPYMLVVGDKEVALSNVSFRLRSGGNIGTRSLPEVKKLVKAAIEAKSQILADAEGI